MAQVLRRNLPIDVLAHGARAVPVGAEMGLEIRDDRGSAREWDSFATLCNASFRTAYRAARFWQLEHHLWHRFRRFSFYFDGRKVAQTAIGTSKGSNHVFDEDILILPTYEALWPAIMAAVLKRLGPGTYIYGSPWSMKPSCETDIGSLSGVELRSVQHITVYAIDFERWGSWSAYFRDISNNVRRNAKKAENTFKDDLVFTTRVSIACLRDISTLLRLRRCLYSRKSLAFPVVRFATRLVLRAFALGSSAFTKIAYVRGSPVAAFGGVTFGENTYYLESGSVPSNQGVSWLLMLRTIEDAYSRAPNGHFVTGYHVHGGPVDDGLEFFRAQCRTTAYLTTRVSFTYGE